MKLELGMFIEVNGDIRDCIVQAEANGPEVEFQVFIDEEGAADHGKDVTMLLTEPQCVNIMDDIREAGADEEEARWYDAQERKGDAIRNGDYLH